MVNTNQNKFVLKGSVWVLVLIFLLTLGVSTASAVDPRINEIRIDQPGADNDEYFEIFGDPSGTLNNLTYIVIGDGTIGASGVIEAVVPLNGLSLDSNGFFVAAQGSFTLGVADLIADLNFENSDNVTHMLVSGFTGALNDDLDINDDGTLDVTPWSDVVDSVALIETDPLIEGEQVYSATQVGPDGILVPGHVFRNPDGTGAFQIGALDPVVGADSPGETNVPSGVDLIPPVITLNGSNPVMAAVGMPYTDLGATAFDNVDGDITGNIVVGGLPIDTSIPGTHMVTYNVSDAAGNPAIEVIRTVNVVFNEPPVIILNGDNPATVGVGRAYVDAGAQAIDDFDGNVSGNIVVGGLPIDTSTAGTHVVTYDVTDSIGAPTHVERTVVVLDTMIEADLDADVVINPDGPGDQDNLGWSVASAGDFNGDGLEDVIVGNPGFPGKFGLIEGGIAYIFFGRSSDTQLTLSSFNDADVVLTASITNGALGASVASAGDFNGDGLGDVIVGASNADRAYVFFGRPAVTPLTLNAGTDADIVLDGVGEFGRAVAGAGDFNGDSFDDVIVGAREADGLALTTGEAYLFLGCDPAGVAPCQTSRSIAAADATFSAQGTGDWFGASVSSAGDFNGDGLDDVLVGAPRDDDNGDNAGRTFLFLGRALPSPINLNTDLQADLIVDGQLGDELGTSVASAGDFNGDGLNDILIGAPEANLTTFPTVFFDVIGEGSGRTGSAYVMLGRAFLPQLILDADQDADVIVNGHGFNTDFGNSVGSAGDFNDDGLSDILVGALDDNSNGGSSGSAAIFTGRPVGPQAILDADLDAEIIMNGPTSSSLGNAVAAAGDFNGDGAGDVIVGARDAETLIVAAGKAYVLFGEKFFKNDVVANITGSGVVVFQNDNTSSITLDPDVAMTIAVADVDGNGVDDVIASFLAGNGPGGTGGTFISRNQGALVLLDSKIAEQIAVGNFDGTNGDDLFLDFGVDGLWFSLNDGAVTELSGESPLTMAVGDTDNSGQDDVVLSLNSSGTINIRNFSVVDFLDASPANVVQLGDLDGNGQDDILASFSPGSGPGGTGGLSFSVNQGALTPLTPLETLNMTSGDYDGSGQDDFLLDFGGGTGLILLLNGASAVPLGVLPVVAMASGDVDSSGQDDILLSITGTGTIAFKNLTTVENLDPAVALNLATGNLDGQ